MMYVVKNDDFDYLDDYYEDDDAILYSQAVGTDYSNVSYADFNKVNDDIDYEDDDDEVVYQEVKPSYHTTVKKKAKKSSKIEDKILDNEPLMEVLSVFWTWFRRLGIVIAVILVAYYLSHGFMKELFQYLLLLVGAFMFGFIFMALISKLMNDR